MKEQYIFLHQWLEENTLVFVEIVVRKKGRQGFFGKIVSLNAENESIVFYDVDQKEVLSFSLNEIDSIQPSEYTEKTPVEQ